MARFVPNVRYQRDAVMAPQLHVQRGFTILELLLVVSVLVALAALVLPSLEETKANAQGTAARASLVAVRAAIVGDERAPGFLTDLGELPGSIAHLFRMPVTLPSGQAVRAFDPALRRGWNGPYLLDAGGRYRLGDPGFSTAYGEAGDPAVIDPWGRPIVLQRPDDATSTDARERDRWTRLVSAGADGVLTTAPQVLDPNPQDAAAVGDDLVLYLFGGRGS